MSFLNSLLGADYSENAPKNGKGSKRNVYKDEIFADLTKAEKTSARREFRKELDKYVTSNKGVAKISEKTAKAFLKFYKGIYKTTDFSLASLNQDDASGEIRKTLERLLQAAKSINK